MPASVIFVPARSRSVRLDIPAIWRKPAVGNLPLGQAQVGQFHRPQVSQPGVGDFGVAEFEAFEITVRTAGRPRIKTLGAMALEF